MGGEGLLGDCVVARKALWNAKAETPLRQTLERFFPLSVQYLKPDYLIIPLENLLPYASDKLTGA